MRFALAAILLAPAAALAQSATFTLQSSDATGTPPQIFVGKANCATQVLHFNWDVSIGHPAVGEVVNIVKARSSGTCSSTTTPTAPDTIEQAPSQAETGNDAVVAEVMILDKTDAGMAGGCDNTTVSSVTPYTTFYCVQLTSSSLLSGAQVSAQFIQVNFATAPPTPPTGVTVNGGDQHLRINWSAGNASENIASYDVHVLAAGDTLDTSTPAGHVSAQTNSDVSHTDSGASLQNNVAYSVLIIANDAYGNVSGASDPVTGMPVAVLDFYNLYRNEGGGAEGHGGCTSSGATWIVLLGLAAALWARRKHGGAALLLLLGLLVPAAARAEEHPARRLLVGLKVDRYDPKVDSEAGLSGTPYHEIFGPRAPLRYQLEVDWEVAHPFGTFLLGATLGFWQNYGKGLVADSAGNPIVPHTPSSDTALLDVMPLGAIATYRFDLLADRWPRFPLIPYVQAGLMRALWASFSGTGSVSKDNIRGGRGSGWTYGYTTALGVAVSLDAIDPPLAREAYVDTGIQRTSVFAEYGWTYLDDFSKSGTLILSDHAWRFGVSVEF
jgi:hypothetical protein